MAPTLAFATGFEHGVVAASAAATGGEYLWDAIAGSPSTVTSPVRSGSRSLEIATSAAAENVARDIAAGNRLLAVVFYVRFASSLPAANSVMAIFVNASGDGSIRFDPGTGQLGAKVGTAALVTGGPVLVANEWYRVNCEYDSSGATAVLKMKVDDGTEFQASSAQAAADITRIRLGCSTTDTYTANFDDFAYSLTAGDYPIGDIYILGYSPNADGTHFYSPAGDFTDAAGTDIAIATAWQQMNSVPLDTVARVEDRLGAVDEYVEVQFADSMEGSDPIHVQVSIACRASGTAACNADFIISDPGSGTAIVFSGDPSQTTNIYKTLKMSSRPASLRPWTDAALDGLRFQFGKSSDVTPDPYCGGVMVEAVFRFGGLAKRPSFDPIPFIPRGRSF